MIGVVVEGVLDQHLPYVAGIVIKTRKIRPVPTVDQDLLRRPSHAADEQAELVLQADSRQYRNDVGDRSRD